MEDEGLGVAGVVKGENGLAEVTAVDAVEVAWVRGVKGLDSSSAPLE